jgi:cysteine desulfurase
MAVGLATALALGVEEMAREAERLSALRNRLIAALLKIPYSRLTGDPVRRLPGNASLVFECVEGESLILGMDMNGVSASSGSACSSGSLDPSHVLLAIGLTHELAHGSVRFSLGGNISAADVDSIAEVTARVVKERRAMSPLWNEKDGVPVNS